MQYDAVNLIERAVKEGISPFSIKPREDDNVDALHRAIKVKLKAKSEITGSSVRTGEDPKTCSLATDAAPDQAELVFRLARYKANYDRLTQEFPANLRGLSWEEIASRLVANSGLLLSRAEAMNGVLFGVDKEGKAVFAPEQKEPELKGMNYTKSRDTVMFETDKQTDRKTPTSYELFDEVLIQMFEQFTGHPVVASEDGKEWRSIWLESGEKPGWARFAYFSPDYGLTGVYATDSRNVHPRRSVRRLLRV